MMVDVSNGELLDKLSILKIKLENIKDENKLVNIKKEFDILTSVSNSLFLKYDIKDMFDRLFEINYKLWQIEDSIRDKERKKEFDEEFVFYARNVYITNDLRSDIKKQINNKTNSEIVEEKSYERY